MDYFEHLCDKVINGDIVDKEFELDNKLIQIKTSYQSKELKNQFAEILKIYKNGDNKNKEISANISMEYNMYFNKEKMDDDKYILAVISIIFYYNKNKLIYLPVLHSFYYCNHKSIYQKDPNVNKYVNNFSLSFQDDFENLRSCIKSLIYHFSNFDKNAYPYLDKFIEETSNYFEV